MLWTNHRAKGGHVDKVHLQARCMKVFARMQAVRAKSVSPTSRGLRLPFPCSEIVDLTQDDEEKRKKKVVKEATRKKWVEKFPWIEWTGCMVLNQLHKKVSQIEIGRLEDGIDDGEPEFDFAFCADDGSDDDGDDDALWFEDEEGSDEVEDESIFALDPDSVAVVQVEGEASFLENI